VDGGMRAAHDPGVPLRVLILSLLVQGAHPPQVAQFQEVAVRNRDRQVQLAPRPWTIEARGVALA
jgi:hypothetical protein